MGANGDVTAARQRAEEDPLERRLLHRLSDGRSARSAVWTQGSRTEALDIIESKRDAKGRLAARPCVPRRIGMIGPHQGHCYLATHQLGSA